MPRQWSLIFLWYDAIIAFKFRDGIGIGVGTIVLIVNAVLLTFYSLSCHSFRHLIGGNLNAFSKMPYKVQTVVYYASVLNEKTYVVCMG